MAERRRWPPLGLAAVALVIAVAAMVVWRAARPAPATLPTDASVRVGVRDGDLIPEYLAAGRAELDRLAGSAPSVEIYALVSLARYLPPDQLVPLLGPGLRSVGAYARVPLPRRQTELVRLPAQRLPADVIAAMDLVAARKSAHLTDPAAGPDPVESAEAAAYRQHCACVYALVVRGRPAALRELAARAEVRGVDPAPEVTNVAAAVFIAPLPEQVDRVQPPPDDGPPPVQR
ncbi:MAG: hypothetical protein ACM30G_11850 [Micromonosporaceae bacterium]